MCVCVCVRACVRACDGEGCRVYVCNCVLYVHCGVLDIVLQFVERVEWFGESDWGALGSVSVCVLSLIHI